MSSIVPVPTTRVGDYFVRQRLVGQVGNDQLELFKLQNQISTGKRLQLPSDDAPAALRAINLQRLLDRKGQIGTNVKASAAYLTAAESNLATVNNVLSKLRGDVVGVSGTLSSDSDRQTLVQQIDQALDRAAALVAPLLDAPRCPEAHPTFAHACGVYAETVAAVTRTRQQLFDLPMLVTFLAYAPPEERRAALRRMEQLCSGLQGIDPALEAAATHVVQGWQETRTEG